MSKRTADVLRKARKLLVEKGWRQRAYGDEHGPYCAVGALRAANGWTPNYGAARRALAAALPKGSDVPPPHDPVLTWNDAPGRTKRQVLAAFDRAIKAEERT